MSQVVIENPVINSPFEEPARHFRFDEQGITNTIVPSGGSANTSSPSPNPARRPKNGN
jgi:type III restriction enzyme